MFAARLFSNIYVVLILQIGIIIVCFFLPEIIFRLTRKERSWHVLLASALLIASVVSLTSMHSCGRHRADDIAFGPQTQGDIECTLRASNFPLPADATTNVNLMLYNSGPRATYQCFLHILDHTKGTLLAPDAYEVEKTADTLELGPSESGTCGWTLRFHQPVEAIIDTYAQKDGVLLTNHQQIVVHGPVAGTTASPATRSPTRTVDDEIWIYYAKTQGRDTTMANTLRSAGYANVQAKGDWQTKTDEQFIFYRDPDRSGLESLRRDLGLTGLRDYFFNSDRIGNKVKNLFQDNPKLRFVVIVR